MCKVSIIVPNYNHSKYLIQRLDSIFNQTYQDFEVILLDDCSTDNSRNILEKYSNHPKVSNLIYNDVNSGTSYKQWYKGIEYAKGELIWIAESDDWCDLRFLETLVPHFGDDEVSIAFTESQWIYDNNASENITIGNQIKMLSGSDFIRDGLLYRNKIYNASMTIFRKSQYEKVKDLGYKEMKLCGDWLLWTHISNNAKVIYVPYKLNYLRRHELTTTSKFRKLGLDFIEGLEVLKVGKQYCNKKYNRRKVYLSWIEYFNLIKVELNKSIMIKVLAAFLIKEPLLFFFLVYKNISVNLRIILKKIYKVTIKKKLNYHFIQGSIQKYYTKKL